MGYCLLFLYGIFSICEGYYNFDANEVNVFSYFKLTIIAYIIIRIITTKK